MCCWTGFGFFFFFLDAGLLCVRQSGTDPYINWQIGSRQPRDSLWCTHCCGCAVTCASPCQWCTLKVSWVWCARTVFPRTHPSLTRFSLNARSQRPPVVARRSDLMYKDTPPKKSIQITVKTDTVRLSNMYMWGMWILEDDSAGWSLNHRTSSPQAAQIVVFLWAAL